VTAAPRIAPGLALIFDMDGVLIDSNPLHRAAWEAFNRRYGRETTEEMHQRMYGRRNDQIVRDFYGEDLGDAEVFARGAAKEEIYRQMMGPRIEEFLIPGVREFLHRYAPVVPIGCATNAEPANVDFLLDSAGLRAYFRVVVDGHQVENPKPHPEVYLKAADLLHTAPANCIVFEDSHFGVEAALAAGMRVVAVNSTYPLLPGAAIAIDNFKDGDGDIEEWLGAQSPAF
jgi:beta-phosphoglucomutase